MKTISRGVAVLGTMAMLSPLVLAAQVDPNASQSGMPGATPYGQSQQNGSQPGQPGSAAGGQTTQPGSMRDSLGAPGLTGQQMIDKQFVRDVAEGGIADVKMGTLATQKGGGQDVKDLGRAMVDDHTAINKDMESVADSLGVMLPKKMNKEQQAEYEKLNGLSGQDFDTEYVVYLAKVHYQELHKLHMEASVAADPGLEAEVVKAMGTMHEHLGLIQKAAKDEGIELPPRPRRPASPTMAKQ
jgi:putative membrane protein